MVKRILFVAAFVALVSAGTAYSQCADPSNMLSSDLCGFDTAASIASDGTGWWNMVPELAGDPLWGTVAHSTTGGRTSAGSMVGTPYDNGPPPMGWGYLVGARYCLPVAVNVGDVIGFGGWVHITSGTVDLCSTVVFTSNSVDCSTGAVEQAWHDNPAVPVGTWTKLNAPDTTLTVTVAASAIELRLSCNGGGSDFSATFDDAYVGLNMVPVNLQSFTIE